MKKTCSFYIKNHATYFENAEVGYHCPICGLFYARGQYTICGIHIESGEEYILCSDKKATCCGKEVATPIVFSDIEEITKFYNALRVDASGVNIVLRKNLMEAHYNSNQKAFRLH